MTMECTPSSRARAGHKSQPCSAEAKAPRRFRRGQAIQIINLCNRKPITLKKSRRTSDELHRTQRQAPPPAGSPLGTKVGHAVQRQMCRGRARGMVKSCANMIIKADLRISGGPPTGMPSPSFARAPCVRGCASWCVGVPRGEWYLKVRANRVLRAKAKTADVSLMHSPR